MADLIDKEQALGCFWNYGYTDGTGYDETEMPAYYRLQALPPVAEVEDCISRQDAIMAVKTGALSGATLFGRTDEGSTALYETVRAIKALPSAQPECTRECMPMYANVSDCISRQAAIDALAKELKGVFVEYRDIAEKLIGKLPPAQPGWIPCSERLPEEDVEVLVYLREYNSFSPFIAWISKADGMWHTSGSILEEEDNPVAWMPLPEPYES